jgi:putative copper resistance protein D
VAGLPPPSLQTALVPSEIDVAAAVLVVMSAWLYLVGVRRLARRGRRWKPSRTAAFLGGLGVLVVATQTGIARYDTALFSFHVAQHVLLSMVAPVLLVLGAPVTLALQDAHGSTAATLRKGMRSRAVRVVTHPVTATALFSLSLYVLYLSSLFELSLRNEVVHAWVHVHLVVVGCLFAAAVVGSEPLPGRWSHPLRLLLVGMTIPAHAILGLMLLSADAAVAGDWYESIERTWGGAVLDDQRTGAAMLWAAGELVAVGVAMVVVGQWMVHSEREARRHDLRLDRALEGVR